MLTDRCHELLAAYVDGELTPRQHKALLRLLQRSAEARDLLRRMQQDAEALRQLPQQRLDRDLSAPVVRLIVERRLQPGSGRRRRITERRQPNFPAWAGFSAAAAALLLVALGSYVYFSASMNEGPNEDALAKGKIEQPVKPPEKPKNDKLPTPEPKKEQAPAVAVKPTEPETVPPPTVAESGTGKPADAAIVAAPDPVAGMEMFRVAPVTPLRIVKLAELDQEAGRQALLKDLRKEPGHRMESPCKNSLKAFDRLKAALTASGIGLVIDQTAQGRMTAQARLTKLKTNFVLYVEDVTPEELVQLLQHAAAEDRKAEKTKKGDTQFEAVVVNAMTDADREELCKLLGVKAKKLPDPPAATGPFGVDVRKPLSEKTGDDIAKNLTGQGGVPRPESGKSPVKPPERLALAMPYNPVRPRPDSPEIKRFLAGRKPPRPGTVQVLLVLREMGA